MQVLVIGGSGYIGSVLCSHLTAHGFAVRALDSNIYDHGCPDEAPLNGIEYVHGDFRDAKVVSQAMTGCDAVVHLGGFVGEPACDLAPDITCEINLAAPLLAADIAKDLHIGRFIFTSTCSVYGINDRVVSERTPAEPLSLYAWTKVKAEEGLFSRRSSHFSVVTLRLATVYGVSPRPRLDSVVNAMSASAVQSGTILLRGGSQWRPVVHVADVAEAIRLSLTSSALDNQFELLNIGSNEQNYSIRDIAMAVQAAAPSSRIKETTALEDGRDYRVEFDRARDVLGFVCQHAIRDGVLEIEGAIRDGRIRDVSSPRYNNFKGLQAALESHRLQSRRDAALLPLLDFVPPTFTS